MLNRERRIGSPDSQELPMGRVSKIGKFIRVSPIQQLIVGVTIATWIGVNPLSPFATIDYMETPANILDSLGVLHSALSLSLIVCKELIARERFSEYVQIRRLLKRHGWNERIVEPNSYSWCQRNAARIAATDRGYGKEIEWYFANEKPFNFCCF